MLSPGASAARPGGHSSAAADKGVFACCISLPTVSTLWGACSGALASRILITQVSAGRPPMLGAKQTCRTLAILPILAPLLHSLVTPSDYSLPGGSSPIASALARRCWPSRALVPSSSHHACSLRGAESRVVPAIIAVRSRDLRVCRRLVVHVTPAHCSHTPACTPLTLHHCPGQIVLQPSRVLCLRPT